MDPLSTCGKVNSLIEESVSTGCRYGDWNPESCPFRKVRVAIGSSGYQSNSLLGTARPQYIDLRCHMAQSNIGIGNVTTNEGLVEMAMAT
jgi:hypothetical protein